MRDNYGTYINKKAHIIERVGRYRREQSSSIDALAPLSQGTGILLRHNHG
jgi:hypothetical protein